MKLKRFTRLLILSLLLVGFLFLSISTFKTQGPIVSATEEQTASNRITVSGVGTVKAKADTVEIILGVTSDGKTAQEAQEANSTAMNNVTRALKNMLTPNDRWETAYVSLYPQYDYSETGRGTLIGFRAENGIHIVLSQTARAGEIIDACVAAGANTVSSIQFSLKDVESLKLEAIKMAMQNAESKANAALQVIGKSITGVESINVSDSYYPPIPYSYTKMEAMGAPSTPVEPGLLEVIVNVTVTYTF
ncbi:MAG: SIMPL domain-containing protein [bacterium]|jgi:uncharacterized protein YggE|nr:SIMPL domain-containing protein [Caldisericota bacterium]